MSVRGGAQVEGSCRNAEDLLPAEPWNGTAPPFAGDRTACRAVYLATACFEDTRREIMTPLRATRVLSSRLSSASVGRLLLPGSCSAQERVERRGFLAETSPAKSHTRTGEMAGSSLGSEHATSKGFTALSWSIFRAGEGIVLLRIPCDEVSKFRASLARCSTR